jgi:predicted permease
VALLSEGLWRRAYGADPGVVGRAVTLEVNASWGRKVERSRSYTVVGVVPASFQPLLHGLRGDVWLPLQATPDDSHDLFVVARMRPGTAPEQVRSDLEAVAAPLRASVHSDGREMRFTVLPLIADLLGDWRRVLLILLGAVGCMLLIACVNVASLALARGRARRGEMAIRAALGAGRARLARQLLTETLLLAGVGGGLAVLVARGGIRALVSFAPPSVPRLEEAGLDLRVLAFMAGVVLLATALAGLWPALGLARTAAGAAWRQGERRVGESRRGRRARGALVAAEMALAIVLLVGSGLMLRTLAGLLRSDPGFDARSVLSFRLSLPGHAYPDGARTADFYERFFAAVATLPGVEAVGVNHALPFGGLSTGTMVSAPGSPASSAAPMGALWRGVSPDYFRALRIPLRRGSAFQPADARPPMRKAIIDEGLARRLWGERDPVGEQIVLAGNPPLTVIGVVGGIRETSLDQDAIPTVYLPFYPRAGGLVVRGGPDAAALAPAVRELLAGVDRLAAASDFQAMAERVAGSFALQRFTTLLLGIFAGAAALIGLVGLYGVVSYSVSQRVRELGVRAALGARRADLVRLVIGQGAFMVAAGVALGLAGAAALARLLAGLLFGVEPVDPLTFAAVPAGLAAAALLACVVPASRAARLDPVEALRHD